MGAEFVVTSEPSGLWVCQSPSSWKEEASLSLSCFLSEAQGSALFPLRAVRQGVVLQALRPMPGPGSGHPSGQGR